MGICQHEGGLGVRGIRVDYKWTAGRSPLGFSMWIGLGHPCAYMVVSILFSMIPVSPFSQCIAGLLRPSLELGQFFEPCKRVSVKLRERYRSFSSLSDKACTP